MRHTFCLRRSRSLNNQDGFGLVETLFALTLLGMVLIALLSLTVVGVQAVHVGKLKTLATQLANQEIESIRALGYDSIGITGGDPDGILIAQEETVTGGKEFTIDTDIDWVDDPVDGIGAEDNDVKSGNPEGWHDYKRLAIVISWNGPAGQISAVTNIKRHQTPAERPSVDFILEEVVRDGKTPPDGAVIGGPESPYDTYLVNGNVPMQATAVDDAGLVSLRFYVNAISPDGSFYLVNEKTFLNQPPYYWNPLALDEFGQRKWLDGTHEVTVEAWDNQGARDAESIFWIIDNDKPAWKETEPANLAGEATGDQSTRLSWTNAWDGVDKVIRYRVYRNDVQVPGDVQTVTMTFDDDGSDIGGLQPWATYAYKLKAVSPGGRVSDEYSNLSQVTTYFTLTTSATKVGGTYKVRLDWSTIAPPVGVTVSYYKVYRDDALIADNYTKTTYEDPGRTKGTTYTYKVRAYNASNQLLNRSNDSQITPG